MKDYGIHITILILLAMLVVVSCINLPDNDFQKPEIHVSASELDADCVILKCELTNSSSMPTKVDFLVSKLPYMSSPMAYGSTNLSNNQFQCKAFGLDPGTKYYYVAQVEFANCQLSSAIRSFMTTAEAVDLGLSVKWASFNVGSTKPENYGDYYAWGETEPYYELGYAQSESPVWGLAGYTWTTYKWCNGSLSSISKYCTSSSYGNVDNKTVLEQSDDVAHVKWGGSWRMPTKAEFDELKNNCTWTWTTQNGVKGYKFTSKKAGYTTNSIFLPAAGLRYDMGLNYVGSSGYYWSSSLDTDNPDGAYSFDFGLGSVYSGYGHRYRYYGQSVRPVSE